jgi:hypothetical protein
MLAQRDSGKTKSFVSAAIVLAGACMATVAPAQDVNWISQFGTAGFDSADDIAADSTYAYVTGRVGFDLALPGQISAGGVDTFVRKLDAAGAEVWTRQFGTARTDGFPRIAVNEGSLYIVGETTGTFPGQSSAGGFDIFIRQYNPDGGAGWTRQLGTSGSDGLLAVAAHNTGLYVFGFTTGVFADQTGAGGLDLFVAKLNFTGNVLWVRQFGTSGNDPAVFILGGIAVDDTGVYVGSATRCRLAGETSAGSFDAVVINLTAAP